MEASIEGLDETISMLEGLQDQIEDLEGEHQVPFDELFSPEFMSTNTNFETIDQMIVESGFKVETSEDFENIPDEIWDEFVSKWTRFENWSEMLIEAATTWASNSLGFS